MSKDVTSRRHFLSVAGTAAGAAKESEVARDREGRVVVYLHWSRLQPLPIAKPDGQSMTRSVDSGRFSS